MAQQYPKASELSLLARLKLIGTLHGRGWSDSRIARELDYDRRMVAKDVATVTERFREFDDLDAHLRDVQARTGEQLSRLNEQEAILWSQLDYAREWVVQTDGFGAPIYEHNEEGAKHDKPLFGPRRGGIIPQLIGQIQSVNKQQAELLGLLNKNIDITVKLQLNERIQVEMLDAIRDTDQEVYGRLIRRLQAVKATIDRPALPGNAVDRSLEDVIDAKYVET